LARYLSVQILDPHCNLLQKQQKKAGNQKLDPQSSDLGDTQGGKGAKISGPSSVLGSGCKVVEFCSGIPPSCRQLKPQSPVPHTVPVGWPMDTAEGASKS
jgi:hypothetical protein